jgi:hypothetical protein
MEVLSVDWVLFGVQWLHVLLGILWFGNSLVLAALVIPALNHLPIVHQREFGRHLGQRATLLFNVVGPLVIGLGFVRGTFLGELKSIGDVFGSPYGITWLVGLTAATATFLWGKYAIEPAIHRMNSAPLNPDGTATAEVETAVARVKQVAILELVGFFTIFTCMILMRFGY